VGQQWPYVPYPQPAAPPALPAPYVPPTPLPRVQPIPVPSQTSAPTHALPPAEPAATAQPMSGRPQSTPSAGAHAAPRDTSATQGVQTNPLIVSAPQPGVTSVGSPSPGQATPARPPAAAGGKPANAPGKSTAPRPAATPPNDGAGGGTPFGNPPADAGRTLLAVSSRKLTLLLALPALVLLLPLVVLPFFGRRRYY
jgi:hypothetical protein